MARNPQISSTVPPDLYAKILAIADREKRTISEMVSLLLERAVKDRDRKR